MDTNKRILLTGKICGDSFEWHIAPLPVEDDEPANGDLQRLIDEATDDDRFDGCIEDDYEDIRRGY